MATYLCIDFQQSQVARIGMLCHFWKEYLSHAYSVYVMIKVCEEIGSMGGRRLYYMASHTIIY